MIVQTVETLVDNIYFKLKTPFLLSTLDLVPYPNMVDLVP